MSYEQLFVLGKPCFYVVEKDDFAFQTLNFQLNLASKELIVRMIRGKKSGTVREFFNESAAALQFPYYFGENWNAFDECITDLDWIEGTAYLLMVSNASSLLKDADSEDFRILLKMFTKANALWLTPNAYIPRDRPPTPFHVLFQCMPEDRVSFSQRLSSFNAAFEQWQDTFNGQNEIRGGK